MDDHLHEIVAQLLELSLFAKAVLERVGGRLELEQAPYARPEDEPVVRFREEVVAARLDGLYAIGGIVERRHEDDRYALRSRVALDAPTNLETRGAIVHPQIAGRHRDVEDHE